MSSTVDQTLAFVRAHTLVPINHDDSFTVASAVALVADADAVAADECAVDAECAAACEEGDDALSQETEPPVRAGRDAGGEWDCACCCCGLAVKGEWGACGSFTDGGTLFAST